MQRWIWEGIQRRVTALQVLPHRGAELAGFEESLVGRFRLIVVPMHVGSLADFALQPHDRQQEVAPVRQRGVQGASSICWRAPCKR